MQAFEDKDLILYLLISAYVIFKDYGLTTLIRFSVKHGYFLFLQLPYLYLCNRFLLPFPYHSLYSQRATDFEYIIVELLKYHYKYLQHDEVGKVFFDGQVFRILNKIRYIRELGDGLGDVRFHDLQELEIGRKDIKGLFFYSQSRVQVTNHDILLLYVHGGVGFGMGSAHMYSEYLSLFLVNLLEQGFTNPAILAPDFSSDRLENYPTQLTHVLNCYQYLTSLANDACHIVVMGDSGGATLVLSLLLHIAKPSPFLMNHVQSLYLYDENTYMESIINLKRPSYSILISPITNVIKFATINENKDDYLSKSILADWSQAFANATVCEQESVEYYSPGQCRDSETWKSALPQYGIFVSYGSEEVITEDIESLITVLKETGCKLKVDKQLAQIHNWPIINFYGERLIDHRELSLQTYSGVLSRVLLWDTASFYDVKANPIVNVIRIDDDYV